MKRHAEASSASIKGMLKEKKMRTTAPAAAPVSSTPKPTSLNAKAMVPRVGGLLAENVGVRNAAALAQRLWVQTIPQKEGKSAKKKKSFQCASPPPSVCSSSQNSAVPVWLMSTALQHLREHGLKNLVEAHGEPGFYKNQPMTHEPINKASTSTGTDSAISNFQNLAKAIVYQQLAGAAASTIWNRLLGLAAGGQGAAGEQLQYLTPGRCEALGEERLRTVGVSRQKTSYILDLSRAFGEGGLDRLKEMSDDEFRAKLLAIKGVGPWTVDMFAIFTLHRPDILPTGDLGVRKGMQSHFGLKDLPTGATMEQLAQIWRPYRSLACWYMWRAGEARGRAGNKKVKK
jgi:DNA-3-methyladenine glycosylase II